VTKVADHSAKVSPTVARNIILAVILGLVLGVGLAFVIDAIDIRVRSTEEIGRLLGLPLLARVPPPPSAPGGANQLAVLTDRTGHVAESFNMLRTNLAFETLKSDDMRVLVVTSAVGAEGKSTTAANLALVEARNGHKVALVDLDLRRPSVHELFGLPQSPGMTDVALGQVTLADALYTVDPITGKRERNAPRALTVGWKRHRGRDLTMTPQYAEWEDEVATPEPAGSLSVLTSGPLPPAPGEFVGVAHLAAIMNSIRNEFDLVIVDTPPLLGVGDTMTLSAYADGIVIVARFGVTKRPMLTEVRRLIDTAPARKIGYVATGAEDVLGYAAYNGDKAGHQSEATTDA
jgi:receptor protein-tyrosine kinase